MDYEFVLDVYTSRRGEPEMLELSCSNCKTYLMTYQKDGPGPLLRCYLDRIHAPKNLNGEELTCAHCHTSIGKKGIYEKEQRLAYFLIEGTFLYVPLSEIR